ncbi:MAG: thiol reductant ABC exporter subunit CydC [Gammaproteobacteria bacterium]
MRDLYRLIGLFKPYWPWLVLGIVLSLVTLLSSVALMAIAGWFITAMAIAGINAVSLNYFTPAALIRGAAIARTLGRYGERLVTHEATFRLLARLRTWFYEHIEPHAPAGLEAYASGDILSRIRADIDTLDNLYLRIMAPVVVALLATILFVWILALYSPALALAELGLLLVAGFIVPALVNRLGYHAGRQTVECSARLRTHLVSDLQGMAELKIYGAARAHSASVQAMAHQLAAQQHTSARLKGFSQGALGFCANLAMWSLTVIAIPLINAHTLSSPTLAMLALFALASFEAVMALPLAFQSLGETMTAARRIFSLIDLPARVSEPASPLPVPQSLSLQLENVTFHYPATNLAAPAVNALHAINLALPAGHKLAIVGSTGSGKSTLIQLLLRFRQVDSGRILLNDRPIELYGSEAIRQRLAVVPQQTHLFNTTLRDNLLLANPQAGQVEIEQACKAALIHDFICEQPQAYETMTGETGINLSGGQARRLAIARALLKPAPVLILDEPTEGLDPLTAEQLLRNIITWVNARQQSLLLITHRLQGLDTMDEIVVMEKGSIVESGRHAELMQAKGRYYDLRSATLSMPARIAHN